MALLRAHRLRKPVRLAVGSVIGSKLVSISDEQYGAARELSNKGSARASAAAERLQAVAVQIAAWLRAGELISALRPRLGGEIGQPLLPVLWQTENWGPRFYQGQMNLGDPFSSSLRDSNQQWIFVSRTSLDHCLGRIASHTKTTIAGETKCERWLIEMMNRSPNRRTKSKGALRTEAVGKFEISRRSFDRVWSTAIIATGATAWTAAGAPKQTQR
jgi:hypothetical protein